MDAKNNDIDDAGVDKPLVPPNVKDDDTDNVDHSSDTHADETAIDTEGESKSSLAPMSEAEIEAFLRPDPEAVPHKPLISWRLLLVLAMLVATAFTGLYYGHRNGIMAQADVVQERDNFKKRYQELLDQQEVIERQLTIYRQGSLVTKQASETVRQENVQLQDRIAELEKELAFFRGIMRPNSQKKGLVISSATFSETATQGKYRFKLVLTQLATRHTVTSGYVKGTLVGSEKGEPKSLSLSTLSKVFGSKGAKFKFRYFQHIDGFLELPEGFVPERVELTAKTLGRRPIKRTETYRWAIQEGQVNVGQE